MARGFLLALLCASCFAKPQPGPASWGGDVWEGKVVGLDASLREFALQRPDGSETAHFTLAREAQIFCGRSAASFADVHLGQTVRVEAAQGEARRVTLLRGR